MCCICCISLTAFSTNMSKSVTLADSLLIVFSIICYMDIFFFSQWINTENIKKYSMNKDWRKTTTTRQTDNKKKCVALKEKYGWECVNALYWKDLLLWNGENVENKNFKNKTEYQKLMVVNHQWKLYTEWVNKFVCGGEKMHLTFWGRKKKISIEKIFYLFVFLFT